MAMKCLRSFISTRFLKPSAVDMTGEVVCRDWIGAVLEKIGKQTGLQKDNQSS